MVTRPGESWTDRQYICAVNMQIVNQTKALGDVVRALGFHVL